LRRHLFRHITTTATITVTTTAIITAGGITIIATVAGGISSSEFQL